jgi:hypothetical protein
MQWAKEAIVWDLLILWAPQRVNFRSLYSLLYLVKFGLQTWVVDTQSMRCHFILKVLSFEMSSTVFKKKSLKQDAVSIR